MTREQIIKAEKNRHAIRLANAANKQIVCRGREERKLLIEFSQYLKDDMRAKRIERRRDARSAFM